MSLLVIFKLRLNPLDFEDFGKDTLVSWLPGDCNVNTSSIRRIFRSTDMEDAPKYNFACD